MNRDANPFFGTNQPSQVSGPDELLACPFCGGEAVHVRAVQPKFADYVMCFQCNNTTAMCDTREQAAALWNARRAANAVLAARCGELQAAIDELVAVTDLREKLGAIDDPAPKGWREWRDDYTRRHPLAWAAARALASQAEGER